MIDRSIPYYNLILKFVQHLFRYLKAIALSCMMWVMKNTGQNLNMKLEIFHPSKKRRCISKQIIATKLMN